MGKARHNRVEQGKIEQSLPVRHVQAYFVSEWVIGSLAVLVGVFVSSYLYEAKSIVEDLKVSDIRLAFSIPACI